MFTSLRSAAVVVVALFATTFTTAASAAERTLLNVSYDVTREFYKDVNDAFAKEWLEKTGEHLVINQSHGGSTKQARAIIDGLAGDVVTMNQALDIDQIAQRGRQIKPDWASRFPNHSVPNTSTIVFLVRGGNPKGIADWADLIKPGVSVVIPNPKTSGNGRYSYLAAWGYAARANGGDAGKAKDFVAQLFRHVPVLDTGGRGATTTFAQRKIGDVLLTFESEADLIIREAGPGKIQTVLPSLSIVADNPVAVVDKVTTKHGTTELATAYLQFLFTPAGQELAAKHHLRPIDPAILAKYSERFPKLELLTIDQIAGSWVEAQKIHFADGGIFDEISVIR